MAGDGTLEHWEAPGDGTRLLALGSTRVPGNLRWLASVDRGLLAADESGRALRLPWEKDTPPLQGAWLSIPPPALGAAERNGLVALASGTNGVWLLRTSGTNPPTLAGHFAGALDARDAGFVASLVCVGDGLHGLKFLDVSDPADPQLVGVFAPKPGFVAERLAISTTLIAVGGGQEVRLLDAGDPRHAVISATRPLPGRVRHMTVANLRLWVACGPAGFVELDLGKGLEVLSRRPTRGTAEAVAVDGARVFVAEGSGGWRELRPADRP